MTRFCISDRLCKVEKKLDGQAIRDSPIVDIGGRSVAGPDLSGMNSQG